MALIATGFVALFIYQSSIRSRDTWARPKPKPKTSPELRESVKTQLGGQPSGGHGQKLIRYVNVVQKGRANSDFPLRHPWWKFWKQ